MAAVKRILLATDLGPGSQSTLDFVTALAGQLDAELHMLHVVAKDGGAKHREGAPDGRLEEARRDLERASLPVSFHRVPVTCAIRIGRPVTEIVAYAREHSIGMITMGTRARPRLTKAILGSVADQVTRKSPCPVLVVPPSAIQGTGANLREAAKALAAELGPGVVGERDESRAKMIAVLTKHRSIGDADASLLIDALEAAGAVTWHEVASGEGAASRYWAINTDVFNAEIEPDGAVREVHEAVESSETSAAIDLLRHAVRNRATDIHIDPANDEEFELRLRIDGRMEHYCRLDRIIALPMIQQLKILGKLDIADPFKAQEGRLHLPDEFKDLQVRITSAPVHRGQAIALRLFSNDRLLKPIDTLGLSGPTLDSVEQMLRRGSGLVLVTGPTGSGKTTTIYSLLHRLSSHDRNIVSVEDPIEYPLPFIRQIGVDPRHGMTMTSGLRTMLRMDPDIVFLGEIRDAEAAEIAMRAGSAGRFVFSTLHTRDVASTITAIRDLRIDPRSLAANLSGIVSQRLVRRTCPDCGKRTPITDVEAQTFLSEGLTPPAELSRALGCDRCRQTGYRDRIGLFETAATTGPLADAILAGQSEGEINKVLRSLGSPSLTADGMRKVIDGLTTLDEVQRMAASQLD